MATSLEEAQALLQNYRQQKQATQPVSSPTGETEQEKAKRLLDEYRTSKQVPVSPQPTPYVAPVSPFKGFAGTIDNALNPLVNAGEGAALSVANTGLGILGGAAKLVGAKGFTQWVEDLRQQGFVKPTENSQKTFAGKAGKTVTDVAQYMAPVGGIAKVGKFALPAGEIAKDTLIGFGQSGGDTTAGAVSGVTSALTGGLSNIPMAKNIIVRAGQKVLPGYVSDVVQGIGGQRGEDRTGASAFIPGAGTAFSAGLNTAIGGTKMVKNALNPETYIKAEAKAWQVPPKEKSAKYDAAKVIQERANAKGIDMQKELVYNQDLAKVNSTKGKLDTSALANRYRTKAADIGKVDITPAIKEVDYAVKHEPISNIFDEARSSVKNNLTPTDELAVLNYLNKQEKALSNKFKTGTLKPSDIYSYKKIYSGSAGYKKGFAGDAIAEQGNTILDKVLKDKLVKIGNETGLPIGDLFKLQEKNYLIADYVKSLDNTKIPLTGIQKARKTGLKLTGAFLGNKAGGLFGAAAGYNAANAIDEVLGNFPNPIKKSILESIQNETPEAQKKLIDFLKMNANTKTNMRALPAPTTIYQGPTQGGKPYTPNSTGFKTNPIVESVPYSASAKNDTSPINMNIEPKKTNIPKTILPIKKSGKQSGFIKNPLVTKVNIHPDDLGEMRDFLDAQVSAYKPGNKMALDNEIAVRRYVEDKFGKNTDNMNPKALARYIGPIVDKYMKK